MTPGRGPNSRFSFFILIFSDVSMFVCAEFSATRQKPGQKPGQKPKQKSVHIHTETQKVQKNCPNQYPYDREDLADIIVSRSHRMSLRVCCWLNSRDGETFLLSTSIGESRLTPVELKTVLLETANICNKRPVGSALSRANVLPDDTAMVERLPISSLPDGSPCYNSI